MACAWEEGFSRKPHEAVRKTSRTLFFPYMHLSANQQRPAHHDRQQRGEDGGEEEGEEEEGKDGWTQTDGQTDRRTDGQSKQLAPSSQTGDPFTVHLITCIVSHLSFPRLQHQDPAGREMRYGTVDIHSFRCFQHDSECTEVGDVHSAITRCTIAAVSVTAAAIDIAIAIGSGTSTLPLPLLLPAACYLLPAATAATLPHYHTSNY